MKKYAWILGLLLCLSPMASFAQTATEQGSSQSQVSDANDPSKMLPQEVEKRFKALRSDPDPDQLVRDAHYWVSNENAQYVWYPYIKDMGGVISGVGTDQVYLLAGWSNASIIIPMDFDKQIRNLHFAYGAAFMASENIEEFRTYWKKENAEKMKAALAKYFPEEADAALKAWNHGVKEVNGRFNRVTKKYKNLPSQLKELAESNPKQYAANAKIFTSEVPTFLTDETQYKRIRQLWMNHRVFPLCGDLTGDRAMMDISKALKDSGLDMMLLYPSNAEHYFEYGSTYRRNIIEMPFNEKGLILRTRQMKFLGLAEDEDYHYNMQTAKNFKLWLSTTNIKEQKEMLRKRTETSTKGLSFFDYEPSPSKKAPEIAPIP